MEEKRPGRFSSFRKYELRVNLVLALASLFALSAGMLLRSGAVVGISLLLLIFFSTYTVYAYVRRER